MPATKNRVSLRSASSAASTNRALIMAARLPTRSAPDSDVAPGPPS